MENNNREQYRAYMDKTPNGLGVFRYHKGTVTTEYLNDAYYAMLGTTRKRRQKQFQADPMLAVHPDDREMLTGEIAAAVRKKGQLICNLRILHADGTYLWFNLKAGISGRAKDGYMFYAAYTNINDLVLAKQQLQESQAMLGAALADTGIQFWEYYPDENRVILCKEAQSAFHKPPVMEDYPNSFLDAIYPEDVPVFLDLVSRARQKTENVSADYRVNNGRECFWVHGAFTGIFDHNGRYVKAIGTAVNITEQKNAEKHFREEEKLRKAFAANVYAAAQINITGKKLEYFLSSGGAVDDEKKTKLSAVVRQMAERIPDREERGKFRRMLQYTGMQKAYQAGGNAEDLVFRMRTDGKEIRWYRAALNFMKKPETGEGTAFLTVSDINSAQIRKMILNSLSTENVEYICYVDIATRQGAIIQQRKDIDHDVPIERFDYDELNRNMIPLYIYEEDRERVTRTFDLENVRRQLKKTPVYTTVYRMDQEGRPGQRKQTTFYYLTGDPGKIVMVRRDVTQAFAAELQRQTELEQALVAAEEANEAKRAFLASMSHDIRTPMNGIINYTNFALQEKDPDKKQAYLEKIRISNALLFHLVNDVLELSRIESGKMTILKEKVDTGDINRVMETTFSAETARKGIHYVSGAERFPRELIWTDSLKLQKIFLNLISNAVKYTPEGGTIWVSVVKLHPKVNGCNRRLIIKDTGIGMRPEFLSHIYEPFAQENREEARGVQGTGLGMTIVKRIVDAMNGHISVQSEPGKGTEFHVDLPLQKVTDSALEPEQAPDFSILSGRRILLVEDNQLNSEIAVAILGKKKIRIDVAENGREGMQRFQESGLRGDTAYDLILMDLRMPVMDGYEAAAGIRKMRRPDARTIPIIAMTADAYEEELQKAMRSGMNAYVTKPITPETLYTVIAKQLQQKNNSFAGLQLTEWKKRTADSPRTEAYYHLLADSFPPEERRSRQQQERILQAKNFHVFLPDLSGMSDRIAMFDKMKISDVQDLADLPMPGFLSGWEFPEFWYLEHFAVDPRLRGKGLGQKMLQLLLIRIRAEGKTVVLEAEPEELGKTAKNRIAFYERNGFIRNKQEYWQPAYAPEKKAVWLEILSCPDRLTPMQFETYRKQIYEEAYGIKGGIYEPESNV